MFQSFGFFIKKEEQQDEKKCGTLMGGALKGGAPKGGALKGGEAKGGALKGPPGFGVQVFKPQGLVCRV